MYKENSITQKNLESGNGQNSYHSELHFFNFFITSLSSILKRKILFSYFISEKPSYSKFGSILLDRNASLLIE